VTSQLVYLYAVIAAPPPEAAIQGIDGGAVRWITEGGLTGAVSDVPTREFDEGPLNEAIKDLNWLGPRAIAHQEVNHRLHEHTEAIVPLAFGSVFRDDDRVRALLREQADAFNERLAAVRGRSEWVVTLHRTHAPEPAALDVASPALRDLRAELAIAAPGRAHLLKRRLAALERDELRRLDGDAVADVMQHLHRHSDDVYREVIPTDAIERPLIRASVLVPRASEAEFVQLIEGVQERWRRRGYQLQLTGPWPPYRFAGLPGEERRVLNVSF
jgi:hypothetical protein